jgi:hypothetical protein
MTAAACRTAVRLLAALLLAALGAPARVQAAGPAIMPPADVQRGMKGYGLTVLSGTRPERFEFEVVGRLPNYFPKGDMVIIRLSGPVIDEAGVFAGMSGSPVYIDGKLLGAVAYGWSYCKVPLAGVTPAVDMMTVRGIEQRSPADAKEHVRRTRQQDSRRLAELMTSASYFDLAPAVRQAAARLIVPPVAAALEPAGGCPAAPPGLLPAGVDPTIRPLPVPLSIGGGMAGDPMLMSMLDGSGFIPVHAAATSVAAATAAAQPPDAALEPGATVGVGFILGDMDVSGVGTLTWSDEEHALAFGHPMFGLGEADYPFVVGEVQAVVPLLSNSFKLVSSGKVIGRLVQDRETAVLARLGEEPPLFPCKVRIRGAVDEDYNYQIAGYWQTAPMLAYIALYYSSVRWLGEGQPCTLDARAEIRLKGRDEPLVFEGAYNDTSPLSPALDLVALPMDALLLNPYQEVEVESVDYEVAVKPGYEYAAIMGARADRTRVEPGGRVTIYVRLKQYRGEEVTRTLTLDVPETARPGSELQILVCDAYTNRMIERGLDPGFYAPTSFEGLVAGLTRPQPNRDLVMRASVMDEGLRYDGAAMPALPSSVRSVMEQNDVSGRSDSLVTDIVRRFETPWVIEGGLVLSLTVKERGPDARRTAPEPGSAPGEKR